MEKTKQAFISQAAFFTQLHIQNSLVKLVLLVASLRTALFLDLRNGSSYYVGLWQELLKRK